MAADMQCPIRYQDSFAVARVVGVLDIAGTVVVRSTLLKCLAQGPEAVLVDLSRMRLADPAALSVFLAVARQAARWPAAQVVLCAPQADAARLLRARAIDRRCPVAPSIAAATGLLRPGQAPPSIREDLLPVVGGGRPPPAGGPAGWPPSGGAGWRPP
ncbi:STAS domain-containing protein, partial [Micromonospora sp. CPCC 205371]|nr:STAS domain-containing protein [Micromonospora sp. CPCC 205371]